MYMCYMWLEVTPPAVGTVHAEHKVFTVAVGDRYFVAGVHNTRVYIVALVDLDSGCVTL